MKQKPRLPVGQQAALRIRRGARLVAGLLTMLAAPTIAAPVSRPDTFLARVEALATLETLNADILASRSATKTLESWCASHHMAEQPKIRAELVPGKAVDPTDEQRHRLSVGPDEPIRYRHVRLTCGTHVLSDADNWYVPARLTPDMNRLLETTDTPFGKVVTAMMPTRETFAVSMVWHVLPENWEMAPPPADHPDRSLEIPPILFEHHAVLFDAHHQPFSEVAEHYTDNILAFVQTPK